MYSFGVVEQSLRIVLDSPLAKSLGHVYGFFNVNDVLRGQRTVSRPVVSMAHEHKEKVKDMLSTALKQRSLTISPMYWSNRHEQVSYLGVRASSIDNEFRFKSVNLRCGPFQGENKSIESTVKGRSLNHLSWSMLYSI